VADATDFPPSTILGGYFYDWRGNGLLENINFELLRKIRGNTAAAQSRGPPKRLAAGIYAQQRPFGGVTSLAIAVPLAHTSGK
jgi:hypothetical protein